jgi:HD-GYP domain-containing protein (c-di-GMP phosphodiesterase class II)
MTHAEPVGAVMAYLEVIGEGAVPSAMFPLHDEAVIGRQQQDSLDSDKFLRVAEQTVSRRHARILRRGDTYFLEDLHSFNGTFVNGERVDAGAWRPLRDGDEIALSSARIVFHSLVVPSRDSQPTIITKSVDATQFSAGLEAVPDAARGDLQLTVQKLHAMAQVGIALGAVTDRATLIEKIMNFIFDLFPLAERAFILLKEKEGERPVPVAARRRDGNLEDPGRARISHTIVEEVLNRKQAILSVDTLADRHFGSQDSIVAQAIRSVMCVPLVMEGEVLGMIQVDTSSDPHAFTGDDLEMLAGVCAEAAVALKNFQLYSDIERLLEGFVRASVQAIEERDPVTAGHSFRVAGYAESLARALDRAEGPGLKQVSFSKEQLREIRYAALLHDFGKVGVREQVLCKQKKLHHADMLLLEQRFRYARASLEGQAFRWLAETHSRGEMDMAAFRAEKERIEAELAGEFQRLDRFLTAIRSANEPAISYTEAPAELKEVLDYAYPGPEGGLAPLLDQGLFSALSISKGCLTPEERRQIEAHVVDSYSFLILIPWTRDLSGVPAIAHGHHEKLDGSGYPMGLKGDQICVQTRILTISDIYDALTAGDRPYKKAMPPELALDLMAEECRSGHLDSRLFQVFVDSRSWGAA